MVKQLRPALLVPALKRGGNGENLGDIKGKIFAFYFPRLERI